MKKINTLRVASIMLALTLITSSFVGGTFAKFTFKKTGGDSAVVAKFSLDGTIDLGLFGEATAGGIKLISPGDSGETKNDWLTLSNLDGETKVDVALNPTLTFTGWTLEDGSEYCPLVFTISCNDPDHKDHVHVFNGADGIEQLKTNVQDTIKLHNKAGVQPDLSDWHAPKISWEWPDKDENNTKDTALGGASTTPTITLNIEVTVSQHQEPAETTEEP